RLFPLARRPPWPPPFPYTTLFRSPFVGAGPRPARILHPAPGHRRGEALPIGRTRATVPARGRQQAGESPFDFDAPNGAAPAIGRSEEHTSELQSRFALVCRLLRAQ